MMEDLTGQQFGNYRLVRLLGRGGFAQVYLGQHIRLASQQAALKILHAQLTEQDVQSFQHEAEVVALLRHPHIIRLLDFDSLHGIPFLVMEYAPYGSLRQRHPKGTRVDLATVIHYVNQVADALGYAHQNKLIHRDIKPENMLIGSRGEILVSDFGLVTLAHNTKSMSTQAWAGTVAYMAPEQIEGKPVLASDQYALGITLYEWLCGERPFQGTHTEMLAKHLMQPPPSLCARIPELPLDVDRVLQVALAKDPKQRFQSMQAFASALQQCPSTSMAPASGDTSQFVSPHPSSFLPRSTRLQNHEPPITPIPPSLLLKTSPISFSNLNENNSISPIVFSSSISVSSTLTAPQTNRPSISQQATALSQSPIYKQSEQVTHLGQHENTSDALSGKRQQQRRYLSFKVIHGSYTLLVISTSINQ